MDSEFVGNEATSRAHSHYLRSNSWELAADSPYSLCVEDANLNARGSPVLCTTPIRPEIRRVMINCASDGTIIGGKTELVWTGQVEVRSLRSSRDTAAYKVKREFARQLGGIITAPATSGGQRWAYVSQPDRFRIAKIVLPPLPRTDDAAAAGASAAALDAASRTDDGSGGGDATVTFDFGFYQRPTDQSPLIQVAIDPHALAAATTKRKASAEPERSDATAPATATATATATASAASDAATADAPFTFVWPCATATEDATASTAAGAVARAGTLLATAKHQIDALDETSAAAASFPTFQFNFDAVESAAIALPAAAPATTATAAIATIAGATAATVATGPSDNKSTTVSAASDSYWSNAGNAAAAMLTAEEFDWLWQPDGLEWDRFSPEPYTAMYITAINAPVMRLVLATGELTPLDGVVVDRAPSESTTDPAAEADADAWQMDRRVLTITRVVSVARNKLLATGQVGVHSDAWEGVFIVDTTTLRATRLCGHRQSPAESGYVNGNTCAGSVEAASFRSPTGLVYQRASDRAVTAEAEDGTDCIFVCDMRNSALRCISGSIDWCIDSLIARPFPKPIVPRPLSGK